MQSNHPLFGAQLRFERADRHLADAKKLIKSFGNVCKQYIVGENHGEKLEFKFTGAPDSDPTLPLIISDAIHNMRSALDYIVFELAKYDSGTIQDGTQFLIADLKTGFDGRKKKDLIGLSDRHIGMIEALQPYNRGGEWTKTLRNISNPDKHRTLTALIPSGPLSFGFTPGPGSDLTAQPIRIDPNDLNIDANQFIQISLGDRSAPVMSTLRGLEAKVSGTIELFKPEFKV